MDMLTPTQVVHAYVVHHAASEVVSQASNLESFGSRLTDAQLQRLGAALYCLATALRCPEAFEDNARSAVAALEGV